MLATNRIPAHDYFMTQNAGLDRCNIVGFVTIVDSERAKSFYRGTLGLRLISEELPFAMVFDANGIMLRLVIGKERPSNQGTVLGWQVPNITSAVRDLARAGVQFERYEYMKQNELGIWTAPSGARVAWFKDPDGNVLSITENPEVKK
jgi:catechol 2,3-dioxygenase-like lactoylglutathione lyase family enzyme